MRTGCQTSVLFGRNGNLSKLLRTNNSQVKKLALNVCSDLVLFLDKKDFYLNHSFTILYCIFKGKVFVRLLVLFFFTFDMICFC